MVGIRGINVNILYVLGGGGWIFYVFEIGWYVNYKFFWYFFVFINEKKILEVSFFNNLYFYV